jgi:hypothetical protein
MVEKIATKRKKYLDPYLVCITKENPFDRCIYEGFLDDIEDVEWHIEEHLPRMLSLKAGKEEPIMCGKCEYCRSVKKTEIVNYHYLLDLI